MEVGRYRDFTDELARRLAADERAIGLVAVGSMAGRDYPPDEWSDHDFFVITPPGGQEGLRRDVSWLPQPERIALSLRETDHGLLVIYEDGHLLELAVFDLEEVGVASVNRYRVLLDRGGVEERLAALAASPRPQRDDRFLFAKVLTSALVAWGRGRRGETLSAAFLVTHATTFLTRLLARSLPAPGTSLLDELDPLRRFERAYPALGAELDALVRRPPAEAAAGLLHVLERELRTRRAELAWPAFDAVRGRLAAE